MNLIITPKLRKALWIATLLLCFLFLICAIWQGYESYKSIANLTDEVITESDELIIEWLADYDNDLAVQEQSRKDIKEIEMRIEEIDRQYHVLMNNND